MLFQNLDSGFRRNDDLIKASLMPGEGGPKGRVRAGEGTYIEGRCEVFIALSGKSGVRRLQMARDLLDFLSNRMVITSPVMRHGEHTEGFTLVEMIIVLILIGIIAVVTIPRAPSRGSLTIDGQANQLASDIRYVQTLSMTRGQRYCLNLAAGSYSMTTASSTCTSSAGVEHPAGLGFPITLEGVTLGWTNLPNNYVIFSGQGVPFSAAATALGNDAVITLSGDGGPKTVTISPVTGRVVVGP